MKYTYLVLTLKQFVIIPFHSQTINNPPIFPLHMYFGEVTENEPAGVVATQVTAIDYDDDPNTGTTTKLIYSIEKNAVTIRDQLIFGIEPETGVIKTLVCCLDRDTKPEYFIQVAATDAGGLTSKERTSVSNAF